MSTEMFNVQRVQKNLEALAELKEKSPNPKKLKQYTGWGGLRNAIFTPDVYRILKKHCSESEIASIKKTISNAYFTPPLLIDFIFEGLKRMNKPFKNILEPSAGHGLFFERMPKSFKEQGKVHAVEMDEVSCRMLRCLYPDVDVYQGGFESYQPEATFDLIIGNPPYGREMVNDEKHLDISALRIHHYFVAKSMRLLAPGGVLAMVLPRYFLDNRRDHARDIIHQEGGSLLAAYRLPDNLFDDAKVTVDVVFLVKEARDTDWIHFDKIRIDNELAHINRYFSVNPAHIIGELAIVEAYGRAELTCREGDKLDTCASLLEQLSHFPPKKLPSIDECKDLLAKKLILIDKEIQSLSLIKSQLTYAQRDLQLMERNFLQQCSQKINLDFLL
ncbi:MAG: Eco57I restriction-modification methylase domain-containing protein [Alphaproteobacteria bacterium]|nr:Eco57I restriction-modification methylase domain-containing protein [Alphaproteobacteria bacterium]